MMEEDYETKKQTRKKFQAIKSRLFSLANNLISGSNKDIFEEVIQEDTKKPPDLPPIFLQKFIFDLKNAGLPLLKQESIV